MKALQISLEELSLWEINQLDEIDYFSISCSCTLHLHLRATQALKVAQMQQCHSSQVQGSLNWPRWALPISRKTLTKQ
jgi:hypothetical protein